MTYDYNACIESILRLATVVKPPHLKTTPTRRRSAQCGRAFPFFLFHSSSNHLPFFYLFLFTFVPLFYSSVLSLSFGADQQSAKRRLPRV